MITLLPRPSKRCVWSWKAWLRVMLASVILMMAVVLGSNASSDAQAAGPKAPAATCVWTGSTSTAWENSANWNACNGIIPQSTDDVTIPSTGVTYEPTISTASPTVKSLTVESDRTLTLSGGQTLTLAGDFTNDGTFAAQSGTTVTWTGTGSYAVNGSGTFDFFDLTINTSSQTVSIDVDINVAGTFTKGSGTFTQASCTTSPGPTVIFTGSSGSIAGSRTPSFCNLTIATGATVTSGVNFNVKRSWTNNGTFTASAGTVQFTHVQITSSMSGSGSSTFANLKTSASGKTVNPVAHSFTINGDITNPGTFTATSGTVTFGKAGTSTCCGSGTTTFYDLQVNNGTTVDVGTNTLFNVTNSLRNQGELKQTQTIGTNNVAFLNVSSGKYYGLEVDPEGSTSMGSTTVTIYGEQTCPSPPSLGVTPIKRCYDIAPTTQTTATVKFWFDDANELNGNVAGSVKIYHQKGGLWHSEPGTYSYGSAGGFDWVQVTGVDEYSPFAGTSNTPSTPTLVELASLTATAHDGYVLVEWDTASEIDNAGFNVWRSEAQAGPYTRLNADLIPARGGPAFGASYSYDDEAVTNGVTYWYKLEDVDTHGVSTFHGPVVAVAGRGYRLHLPLVLKGG